MKRVFLLRDNALVHKLRIYMNTFHDLNFEMLERLPSSPDLAALYYHLFPEVEKAWKNIHSSKHDEITEGMVRKAIKKCFPKKFAQLARPLQ